MPSLESPVALALRTRAVGLTPVYVSKTGSLSCIMAFKFEYACHDPSMKSSSVARVSPLCTDKLRIKNPLLNFKVLFNGSCISAWVSYQPFTRTPQAK